MWLLFTRKLAKIRGSLNTQESQMYTERLSAAGLSNRLELGDFYRPRARLWECSQSGVQNNKISFYRSVVLSSRLAVFPQTFKGSISGSIHYGKEAACNSFMHLSQPSILTKRYRPLALGLWGRGFRDNLFLDSKSEPEQMCWIILLLWQPDVLERYT